MSRANCIDDSMCEDESETKEGGLTKLIEVASPKLNFLQVFDDRIEIPLRFVLEAASKTSLRCQYSCQNIGFKSLLSLGARDSLENVCCIQGYDELSRKNLMRSFVRVDGLDRQAKRTIYRNKAATVAKSNEPDSLKSTRAEVNVRKLRYESVKERKGLSRGISMRKDLQISPNNSSNSLKSAESYSGTEMILSLEKLNLNSTEYETTVGMESLVTSEQSANDETSVNLTFERNALSTWIKDASMNDYVNRLNSLKVHNTKRGLQFHELNEVKSRVVCSPRREETEDNSLLISPSCASALDFSSGDDSRNLGLKLPSEEIEINCKTTCFERRQNQDYESKRSVQWNSEVDVIYYAGDADGGKIIRRKIEPLREEADQQARRNSFIKLTINKNLMSAINTGKFLDPWITVFHK